MNERGNPWTSEPILNICYRCHIIPCMCPQYSLYEGKSPHVCPKCKGEGTEDGSKRFTHGSRAIMNCWPCGGTGIVWG